MSTTTENLFESASRQALRFKTASGLLTVEDLWALPLTSKTKVNLDAIAIELDAELKSTTKSFVGETSAQDKTTQLKFEIVKHVIGVRVAENQAKLDAQTRAAQRQQIEQIIERKQAASMENMSLEDLQKLKESL